jgi:NAD(P)-dependent dehydrogenase (short-subunit alcohol dehydrogenase family)
MKPVLITGANRGIGLETARQLVIRGFHVVIGAARSEQRGEKALRELQTGGKVWLLIVDVTRSAVGLPAGALIMPS